MSVGLRMSGVYDLHQRDVRSELRERYLRAGLRRGLHDVSERLRLCAVYANLHERRLWTGVRRRDVRPDV